MKKTRVVAALDLAALGTIIAFSQGAVAQRQTSTPSAPAAVVCSALEVRTAEQMGVALLVFHQANSGDGSRLGELLKQNDGASVVFETSDGRTQTATLFRLGTCFGRGLLVFPARGVHLTSREQFRLRFPQERKAG